MYECASFGSVRACARVQVRACEYSMLQFAFRYVQFCSRLLLSTNYYSFSHQNTLCVCVCACVRACVCACVRTYVRACIRAYVCACVRVSVPPPPFRHNRLTATTFGTHMRIDPGIIRTKKMTHPTPGGPRRDSRGSTIQKSGKFHELHRKSIKQFTPHPTGVWKF